MFGIARAPEIERAGQTWFNVDRPLSLADLKGRMVVLDFWTFCCVNCIHTLPTLKFLEEAYPDQLIVIGVHSPKFDHECQPAAVADAIARYGITHPVVHDPHLVLWEDYCIRAWPTLLLISPDGHVIGQLAGEPHPDMLINGIGDMLARQPCDPAIPPPALPLHPAPLQGGALRFPGKIKPCPDSDGTKQWAVADSGHNQIVLLDDGGREIRRWGSGEADCRDGIDCAFDGPEGLVCSAESIYVADTRNHAIRRIDRATNAVTTLAGFGCRGAFLADPTPGEETALASPWDVELAGRHLYFANAGSHQLGRLDLVSGTVSALAGSGGENIGDGPGDEALLAQPSGLALCQDGDGLFFADSETSAIRRLCLKSGTVRTLAGSGLFDFGHQNGPLAQALFQHPLAVAALPGKLFVADSYNGAIRVIDLDGGTVADIPGADGLKEPAGITADGPGRLLVSDTNRHRIVEIDLIAGQTRTWAGAAP
jgi:thiol-disulfide isomerase/thioredoxin/DNA-binding beta-propeller fold protein YncE